MGGRPAGRRGDVAARSVDNLPAFALRVGLGPVPASRTHVLAEIGDRLDEFEPRLSQTKTDLELSLTIKAGDLWVAVLVAMAAVTGTGYTVEQLDVRPLRSVRR